MNGAKKLYVKSFGCQMNVYDSQRMADTLAPEGYVETASPDDADLVILNTCHIREKAAEKVYSELGRVRRMKDAAAAAGRRVIVAVAGCVAQAEGEEIIRRAPAVDLVVGSAELSPPARSAGARRARRQGDRYRVSGRRQIRSPRRAGPRRDPQPRRHPPSSPCRKAATSSAPSASCLTRAARRCRGRSNKILAEIERLADAGVREVTLIGQNVNAYHGDGPDGRPWSLARLLEQRRRSCRASTGCVTPPAIRATWTTISSPPIAICRS